MRNKFRCLILVTVLLMASTTISGCSKKEDVTAAIKVTQAKTITTTASIVATSDVTVLTGKYKDGTYKAESADFDAKSGYKDTVVVTVTDGAIVSVVWDGVDKDGVSKRDLSESGKYVMVAGKPEWHKQADLLANNVIENQSLEGLTIDPTGKTDAISGVSIAVTTFEELVLKCLEEAKK